MNLKHIILASCMALLSLSCTQSTEQAQYSELSGEIFHTYYRIKYDKADSYQTLVDSTFARFSHSLNPFDSTSLISAINRSESTQTDSMLRHVWLASERISRASGGSYDVTCSPLINAWGFGFNDSDAPHERVLDSLRQFVGYQGIRLDGEQMIKSDPRMTLNFSSISKGYCADLVGEALLRQGAENYMVELGGEIAFRGLNPQGEPWRIGVNKPVEDRTGLYNELQVIIALKRPSGGLATSGNYRNYRTVNGQKVAHTIDPRTARPIQTDVLSATIIAPTSMLADGLATACMTKTAKEVPNFLAQFDGVDYLIIYQDGEELKTLMNSGFQALVVE